MGVTTTVLLSMPVNHDPDRVALLWAGAGHGTLWGTELARVIMPLDAVAAPERIQAAGLGGSMAGVGLAVAFGRSAAPVAHQAHVAGAALLGGLTGWGLNDMIDWPAVIIDEDGDGLVEWRRVPRRPMAAVELASVGVFSGTAVLGNRLGLEPPSVATWGSSLVHGAWIGGWTPYLFSDEPDGDDVTGGLRVGLGAG